MAFIVDSTAVATASALITLYGDVVRIATDELSFAHGQGWKEIYGTSANARGTRAIRGVEEEGGARSVVTSNGEDHTRQKRMMTQVLAEKTLKENEETFVKYTDLLVQRLEESKGEPLNISDWYNFMTFDVIGELLFSECLGLLTHSKYIPWVESVSQFLKAFAMIVVLNEYWLFRVVWNLMPQKLLSNLRRTFLAYTSEKLERYLKRTEADKNSKGIIGMLLDGGSRHGITMRELHSNAPILVFGGSETTATQLRCLTFLLFKNPRCMEKLVKEIRTKFSASNEITYDALLGMKYLTACMEETLRVYPPCTNGLPRVVQKGGAMICDELVPAGTNVSVAAFSLFRSPKYFHLPDSFVPERWLADVKGLDPQFAKDDKAAYQPFSYGAHNCPGKKMAYYEARLIVSKLLWHFDLEIVPKEGGAFDNWDHVENYQTYVKLPLWVKVTPVKR
ncbi:benzoate 4-monooxygenase cytochrome P450 [Arthroderma uncinatum]|uniref:benzoate 4-monooxygenase cytochrome P450 n=1 Tax=Arthroderma uncinatum TaxID=74035 RepID=UPI00144AADFC|nr:benzoate 4-monooxygenase cytochrome P450 [Arthroderma uncinatum]KAF3484021.1 benzoate 4-monooxygenase cytochrome P450 [Arthroderma uncinatum]